VILLAGLIAGLIAALLRIWMLKRRLKPLQINLDWLVLVAFLPQLAAFGLPFTRQYIPDDWARAALVTTQALLLVFAWFNRKQPAFWALGLGLLLNFIVIVANGGLMPISPETVGRYLSDGWQVGQRLGYEKDIILAVEDTRLWFLSDRFTLPDASPWHVAFSLGDIFIAGGAFWLMWSLGDRQETKEVPYDTPGI